MHAWHKLLEHLQAEMGKAVVDKWIGSLKILKFDACNIYLEATDKFQATWVKEHLLPRAKGHFLNNNGHPIKINLKVRGEPLIKEKGVKEERYPPSFLVFNPDGLNEHYSFSSFYPSDNNDLCYKFLLKLASENGDDKSHISLASFNPILIYGPSGCGKTHLLMSLTKVFLQTNRRAFYVKAQTFTSHVINAIRLNSLQDFRNTYRKVDILIIDDIHLLAGKSATQEEFFHTFNTLYSLNSQIIMSSNIPPSQMKDIEPRLISRFEWGINLLLTNVDSKNLRRILDTKEKAYSISLDEKTKDFLIENFKSAQDLEKAIQALLLRTSNSKEIDLATAKSSISDLIETRLKIQITPSSIIDAVAQHFGIFTKDILGSSQRKDCTLPRQIAVFFCREKLNLAYKKIGEIFDRDHSTIMSSVKFINQKKQEKNNNIYFSLLAIEKKLSDEINNHL